MESHRNNHPPFIPRIVNYVSSTVFTLSELLLFSLGEISKVCHRSIYRELAGQVGSSRTVEIAGETVLERLSLCVESFSVVSRGAQCEAGVNFVGFVVAVRRYFVFNAPLNSEVSRVDRGT